MKVLKEENYCQDLTWAIGLNRLSLRLIGVWPTNDNDHLQSFGTTVRIPFMILVVFIGLFLPQVYALPITIKDLSLAIDNLLTCCPTLTSCVKIYFIWRNKKVLRPVVQSVTTDWLKPYKFDWEMAIMRRRASLARLITIADYSGITLCFSGYIILPVFGFKMRIINNLTDFGDRYLAVQSRLPYDYTRTPQFELTHAVQLLASLFVAMFVCIPDDYFCALVLHMSGQYQILGRRIENYVKKDEEERRVFRGKMIEKNADGKIGFFVDRHVHLNEMVLAVQTSFAFVIAAQIFCMSITVMCLGFHTMGMLDSNSNHNPSFLQMFTIVGTLFTMMLHTLVDCFASETLASCSGDIFFNIYSSKWYLLPWQKKRCLIPMMMVARNPRQLKAGKILNMSLETYCSIIKSTAGYISMLIAVSGR